MRKGDFREFLHVMIHPNEGFEELSYHKRGSPLLATVVVVCFFLFIRILVAWGIQLYPYKTFFTNGHREGDFIYEIYEYDQNYDKDKFYK